MSFHHAVCSAIVLAMLAVSCPACAADLAALEALEEQARAYQARAEYAKAEEIAMQALRIAERDFSETDYAATVELVGHIYRDQGRYADAEKMHQRTMQIHERNKGRESTGVGVSLHNLGSVYALTGRHDEAERAMRESIRILEKRLGPRHAFVATGLSNLAGHLRKMGRYAEAERLALRSLAMFQRIHGPEHLSVATALESLGNIAFKQNRLSVAAKHHQQVLAIREKALGTQHPLCGMSMNNLAVVLRESGEYDKALSLYRRSLEISEQSLGPEHPELSTALSNMASCYVSLKQFAEAEPLHERALRITEKGLGQNHPDVANRLRDMAAMYIDWKKHDQALPLLDRAIAIFDSHTVAAEERARGYWMRAVLAWEQKRPEAAFADLKEAMRLAELERSQVAGAESERATTFFQHAKYFQNMVAWQAVSGDLSEALDAMERSRARSLVDLMKTQGADLLAGVPADQAATLRAEELRYTMQLTSLSKQLDLLQADKRLSDIDRNKRRELLQKQLETAQTDLAFAYRNIRTASPAVRLALGRDLNAIKLTALAKWVAAEEGALLQYSIGAQQSFVLVVAAGEEPTLVELTVGESLSEQLGTTAGPLTDWRLHKAMQIGELELQQILSRPDVVKPAILRLAALYEALIPPSVRETIAGDGVKRLFVIPDGVLATLPFEMLVTETGGSPRYLLDDGPPIAYAPSSTLLVNLHGKPAADKTGARFDVLSVADPVYRSGRTDDTTFSARYAAAGGKLSALPNTGIESKWIGGHFQAAGLKPGYLHKTNATEAAVRMYAPGQKILHLACHGLVDQEKGNFFGCLALSPGRSSAGTRDDGFLTLPEIYELELEGCELAILSACSTNFGPQQQGEGVWGLSRGFVVAGSRRVVASNWQVNDRAAASLISYYCSAIANAEKIGKQPAYAAALHAAKRWTRDQKQWQSPYYWAPFVHIGPP